MRSDEPRDSSALDHRSSANVFTVLSDDRDTLKELSTTVASLANGKRVLWHASLETCRRRYRYQDGQCAIDPHCKVVTEESNIRLVLVDRTVARQDMS